MDQDQFGRELADSLYAAERAVDLAVAALCDLGAIMVRGRLQHGISAVVGQVALADVMAALPLITRGRDRLVRAHRNLTRDARAMRIDWTDCRGGPETKPPPDDGDVPLLPQRLHRVA
ncbi:MAG: hypothetical protein ACI9YM_000340 [Brevundimonas sp.]|jgi:hypothetical protein|uniref:hypothetical protein n=1 Tax=Brevundimonas sp. TaxID=1871086 RepID=UPI0024881C8F|nr:hypothetical protein [Brevundimonas sp.]MDI1282409.1 hypothetical protein [Brevundimonas sp.]